MYKERGKQSASFLKWPLNEGHMYVNIHSEVQKARLNL